MAVKTKKKPAEKPFIQFSKKLITFVMVFWAIIRLASVVAVIISPESGTSMAAIVRGVDDIAMVNVLAYTGNSISEKVALGYFKMRSGEKEEEENEDENKSVG